MDRISYVPVYERVSLGMMDTTALQIRCPPLGELPDTPAEARQIQTPHTFAIPDFDLLAKYMAKICTQLALMELDTVYLVTDTRNASENPAYVLSLIHI